MRRPYPYPQRHSFQISSRKTTILAVRSQPSSAGRLTDISLCGAIIEALKLRRPIYRQTAGYGHFGREENGFTWEEKSLVDTLKGVT